MKKTKLNKKTFAMGNPSSKSNNKEDDEPYNTNIVDANIDVNEPNNTSMINNNNNNDTGSPVLISETDSIDEDLLVDTLEQHHGSEDTYTDCNEFTETGDDSNNDTTDTTIHVKIRPRQILLNDALSNNNDMEDPLKMKKSSVTSNYATSYLGNVYDEEKENSRLMSDSSDDDDDDAIDKEVNSMEEQLNDKDDDRKKSRLIRRRKSLIEQENDNNNNHINQINRIEPMIRKLSHRVSMEILRRQSDLRDTIPETPKGWAVLFSITCSILLGYEIQLQKQLTQSPTIYGQIDNPKSPIYSIYHRMIMNNHDNTSVLTRPIKPSLFVGTRSAISSIAAYLFGGPKKSDAYIQLREVITIPQDGAKIALDWELPTIGFFKQNNDNLYNYYNNMSDMERTNEILYGPITLPIVIILHGINNDASFGYMRSLMRTCTNHGWIACGFNFRGCGGIPLATPRGYNGAYTGDIRGTIQILSSRLADSNVPIFLVGNSLGANLIAKYLGEESKSNTLPLCIAGGITLANPMTLHANKMNYFWSIIIAGGAKIGMIPNIQTFRKMNTKHTDELLRHVYLKAITLQDFDNIICPFYQRNDPEYPFTWRSYGYNNAEEYWNDASSSRVVSFINVPFLQLLSKDDFLAFNPHTRAMNHNVSNPNVMVIETACGGHLGWQESKKDDWFGLNHDSTSWANLATAEFIQAILDERRIQQQQKQQDVNNQSPSNDNSDEQRTSTYNTNESEVDDSMHNVNNNRKQYQPSNSIAVKQAIQDAMMEASELRSRL